MMTESRAAEIARRFLSAQDLRGFRYTFLEARPSAHPGRWTAAFMVETSDGVAIEGPVVVVIEDDESARFLTPA